MSVPSTYTTTAAVIYLCQYLPLMPVLNTTPVTSRVLLTTAIYTYASTYTTPVASKVLLTTAIYLCQYLYNTVALTYMYICITVPSASIT